MVYCEGIDMYKCNGGKCFEDTYLKSEANGKIK
jgi:hypothetical protein